MTETNQHVILTTKRLMLRAASEQDATSLYTAFSDQEVMRYWDSPPHATIEDTRRWVEKMIASPANGTTEFVICRTSTPSSPRATYESPTQNSESSSPVVGKIGIWNPERGEIGFLLARSFWRQGLVSEALEMLLPYFFEQKSFDKITADIDPRNEASRGILGKFGFSVVGRREGTFNVGGEWVDSLDLMLTKEEYLKRKSADLV